MSSERAGTPTHGQLDREKARHVLKDTIGFQPNDAFLDALEACVVPDPRITRIEALPIVRGQVSAVAIRAILRGEDQTPVQVTPVRDCQSYAGMSMCMLTPGHKGPHHDNDSGRSW